MKTLKYIPFFFTILVILSACKKTDDEIQPSLSINPAVKSIESNLGSFKVAVTSTVKWTVSSDISWLTVDPINGTGDGTIQIDYQANTSANVRSASVTFKGSNVEDKILTVTQAGILPILTVTPSLISVSSSAGSSTIDVKSNLSWTATSNQTWCIPAQPSGIGNVTLTVNYLANTSASQRTAIITFAANGIANQTFQITQAEFIPGLSITPSSLIVNSLQGIAEFSIISNIPWTATCGQNWCTITNPVGSSSQSLLINYGTNTTSANRIATIIIKGNGVPDQSATLTQTTLIPSLLISPANRSVSSAAGSTTFDITSNIPWSAQSDQAWCTVANPTGSGNALLNVNYEENTSNEPRVANFTLSGNGVTNQNVTVSQIGGNSVVDFDGNIYHSVDLGTQVWLLENLKVTHYNNGDPLPNITDWIQWCNLGSGAYCNYNDDVNNVSVYGRLYNWFAANDGLNICPDGWHVPTDSQWYTLINFLGGENFAGGNMKETGYSHWLSPNTGASNASKFTALPAGWRDTNSINADGFAGIGELCFFWLFAKEPTLYNGHCYQFSNTSAAAILIFEPKTVGASIRCIKD